MHSPTPLALQRLASHRLHSDSGSLCYPRVGTSARVGTASGHLLWRHRLCRQEPLRLGAPSARPDPIPSPARQRHSAAGRHRRHGPQPRRVSRARIRVSALRPDRRRPRVDTPVRSCPSKGPQATGFRETENDSEPPRTQCGAGMPSRWHSSSTIWPAAWTDFRASVGDSPVALLRRRSTNPDGDLDGTDRPPACEDRGHEGEIAGGGGRELEVVGFSRP